METFFLVIQSAPTCSDETSEKASEKTDHLALTVALLRTKFKKDTLTSQPDTRLSNFGRTGLLKAHLQVSMEEFEWMQRKHETYV